VTNDHDTGGECTFCGRDLSDTLRYDTADDSFCSPGCRTVSNTLGADEQRRTAHDGRGGDDQVVQQPTEDTPADVTTEAFIRVDGMHSVTCEACLEARAEACDGVVDAEASYVTETIRIDYDPDRVSIATLCETLSPLGYAAVPKEDASIDSTVGPERGDRDLDSVLGYRYAVGVLFGSFLMLTYVVLLYPAHLSALLGAEVLPMFAGGTGFGGSSAVMILPLFLVLTGVILFFTGLPLLRDAYVSLTMGRPTTELLTAVTVVSAYLYSTIAMLLGRTDVFFDLTIVIAAVVVAAMFYESLTKQRAMDRLTELTISQIAEARRYRSDGTTEMVPVEDLQTGDEILVRQGERIPVDGVLTSEESTVDEAVITGESLPIVKEEGEDVVGGSIVTGTAAVISVTDDATSSIDRLLSTVWDLQSATHSVQRRANRLAGRIIPVLAVVALLVGGFRLLDGGQPARAVLSVLGVLLVLSPWALGLATPLSVARSIEVAMQRGIVIFDETIFERLRDIDVVVFDKTGTLTTGQMTVIDADVPPDLLAAAATLERRASHPAAAAIVAAFESEDGELDGNHGVESELQPDRNVEEFRNHSMGVEGVVSETAVLVGHPDLFERQGWTVSEDLLTRVEDARHFGRLPVLVGRDGQAEGLIILGDEPRARWDDTITRLHEQDIDTVVLTGDDEAAAEFFGQHPHVEHVFADVPPAGKTATVRRLQADNYVTMVGDGTNDAPSLAQADLGIALGSGTAIASDAADLTIVDDDIGAVVTSFTLAHAAQRRVRQNTALGFLYNALSIPLAVIGLFNPLLTMAAVLTSAVVLAANSFREFHLG
jgi:heavy metal translocating P-type ATPase